MLRVDKIVQVTSKTGENLVRKRASPLRHTAPFHDHFAWKLPSSFAVHRKSRVTGSISSKGCCFWYVAFWFLPQFPLKFLAEISRSLTLHFFPHTHTHTQRDAITTQKHRGKKKAGGKFVLLTQCSRFIIKS